MAAAGHIISSMPEGEEEPWSPTFKALGEALLGSLEVGGSLVQLFVPPSHELCALLWRVLEAV